MSVVYLDPDALNDARDRLRQHAKTLTNEANHHNGLGNQVENVLGQMAHIILSELNPLHAFDPFGPWEQWGLGSVAGQAHNSHDTVSGVHTSTQQILDQLRATHGALVGNAIISAGGDLLPHVASALGNLENVTGILYPNNLLWLVREPWELASRFFNVAGACSAAASAFAAFAIYLEHAGQHAEDVIREIERGLAQGSSEVEKWVGDGISLGGTALEAAAKAGLLGHFAKSARGVAFIGDLAIALGLVTDLLSSRGNPRTIAIDVEAAVIGAILDDVPIVNVVTTALTVESLAADVEARQLDWQAQHTTGWYHDLLKQDAKSLRSISTALDVNKVYHDLGTLTVDLSVLTPATSAVSLVPGVHASLSNVPGDVGMLAKDTWGVINAQHRLEALPMSNAVSVASHVADVSLQQSNAPGWLKSGASWTAHSAPTFYDNYASWFLGGSVL